jgi:hypothetical protein
MVKKFLLLCGIISSLWYFALNIIVPLQYEGYNIASQTVSELSAIDAPTRQLWMILCAFYTLLMIAFGCGIWLSADGSKKLKWVAIVIIVDALFGAYWPPMHQREVLAAGGGTLTDTLHIAWTVVHLVLMLLMIGFSAAALGKGFRIYSFATVLVFLVFGFLTGMESPGMETNKPTPNIGILERINMAAYMMWIIVFAIVLLRKQKKGIEAAVRQKSSQLNILRQSANTGLQMDGRDTLTENKHV